MSAIEVSAKIHTVNSYGDKTVSTALTWFSPIRNNPNICKKKRLPHISLELQNTSSQKFKVFLGYSMFFCHSIFGSLTWFSIDCHLLFQVAVQNTQICNRGRSFLFLTVTSARRSPSSSWKHCAHNSSSCSTPVFQRQSRLQCFPWSPSHSLYQVCFVRSFVSIAVSPGQPPTCCWVGCACHTAGSCLLLRHRCKRPH